MNEKDTVFYTDLSTGEGCSIEDKVNLILDAAKIDSFIRKNEIVAIKVHVGERGNLGYLSHNFSRIVVKRVKKREAKPFLTDTCTLYSGGRHNAVDHCITAEEHGFNYASTGAVFIPADGLRGDEYEEIPFNGKHFNKVRVATLFLRADKIIFLTHFKGHLMAGFGGSMKNLAMGCSPASGKKAQHSDSKPFIKKERCTSCGQCLIACPAAAISWKDGKADINYSLCIGCGQCVAVCNFHAAEIHWDTGENIFIEKMSEYAVAIHKALNKKVFYINFALNITPDCDCWGENDLPVVLDTGIFASTNPLALDRATLDEVNKSPVNPLSRYASQIKPSQNIFNAIRPHIDCEKIFSYSHSMGLSDSYELKRVK